MVRPRPARRPAPGACADEEVTLGGGDRVLQLGAFSQSFQSERGRDLVGKVGGVRPGLFGEGKETGPIQLRRSQELEEQIMIALCFPDSPG